jgi:hypothetical protein
VFDLCRSDVSSHVPDAALHLRLYHGVDAPACAMPRLLCRGALKVDAQVNHW